MVKFLGYEDYCRAFSDNSIRPLAELICFSRSWLSKTMALARDGEDYFGLNSYNYVDFGGDYDPLSRIIDNVSDAFGYLSQNLREKIVRENELVPIYQAREINSTGMNWISRRPGDTIRKKLSGTNTIMAVKRKFSLDTGENRLLVALLRELSEHIEMKNLFMPKELVSEMELDFFERVLSFLKRPDIEEIARWENLPPNNTLLSDRYYKKIWDGWNELNKLDSLIKEDAEHIEEHLAVIAFWKIVSIASKWYIFAQDPVVTDYDSFTIRSLSNAVRGITSSGNEITMSLDNNSIIIRLNQQQYCIMVENSNLKVIENGRQWLIVGINARTFETIVEKVAGQLPMVKTRMESVTVPQKSEQVFADFFSLYPSYYSSEDKVGTRLSKIIAYGKYQDNSGRKYSLDLDNSGAVSFEGMEGIVTPFNCETTDDCYSLFSILSRDLPSEHMTFLFPDIFNEFKLSSYRRAARMYYKDIATLPRSIAAAFVFEQMDIFKNDFGFDDVLLIVDTAVVSPEKTLKSMVTITMIKRKQEELPGENINRDFVWERYPAVQVPKCVIHFPKIEDVPDGIPKVCSEDAQLRYFNGNEWKTSEDITGYTHGCDITSAVRNYIDGHRNIIGTSDVYVICLDERAYYNGDLISMFVPSENLVIGSAYADYLSKTANCCLWRDHLPNLAIKLLLDQFDLVKDQMITPLPNEEIKIDISNIFTLPAKDENCRDKNYHFQLIQDDDKSTMQYQAEISHKSFPLRKDVECRLEMRYKYGADDPYTLKFIPLDKSSAGFSEVKVKWTPLTEYPVSGLIYPSLPKPMSREELRASKGKRGASDLIEWFESKVNGVNNLYYYNFAQNPTHWRISGNPAALKTVITVPSIGAVRVFESNFVRKSDCSEYVSQIFFDVIKRTNSNTGEGYWMATNIVVNRLDYHLSKYGSLASALFPLHCMVAGGRSVDEFLSADTLKALPAVLNDIFSVYKKEVSSKPRDMIKYLTVMCLLHDKMGSDFYDYLCDEVDEYIRINYVEKNQKKYLNDRVGFALGNCVSENEIRLCNKIFEIYENNGNKIVNIFSLAAWKYNDFILNAPKEMLMSALNCAIKVVIKWAKDIDKGNDIDTKKKGRDFVGALEYILAVFRLRQLNDDDINRQLSRNNDNIRKLIDALELIALSGNEVVLNCIKSRIQLEITKESNIDIPPLLYALLVYANGNSVAGEIRISGVSDDVNDDNED